MIEIREVVPADAEAISELNDLQMGYTFGFWFNKSRCT